VSTSKQDATHVHRANIQTKLKTMMLTTAKSASATTTAEKKHRRHAQNVYRVSTRRRKARRSATSAQQVPRLSEGLEQDRAPHAPPANKIQRPEQTAPTASLESTPIQIKQLALGVPQEDGTT
jgi:hypothetical protein